MLIFQVRLIDFFRWTFILNSSGVDEINLGKTIYEQRIKKNLSQGDLANLLIISRQSVSKWENNSAVPDLEKMMKLSEIFEISLDELVKGIKPETTEHIKIIKEVIIQEPKREGRKTAAIVLFFMAFLGFFLIFVMTGSLGGIIYALPFLVCGIICLVFKKNVGLWCAWAIYLLFDMFLRWATGITIGMIRLTPVFTADMNYARLAMAYGILAITLILMGVTIHCFVKQPFEAKPVNKKLLFGGWIGWILFVLIQQLFSRSELHFYLLSHFLSYETIYTFVLMFVEWIRRGLLMVLIIITIRFMKSASQSLA